MLWWSLHSCVMSAAFAMGSSSSKDFLGGNNGCTSVEPKKCGTDWYDNCLQCNTTSTSYDCLKCCEGCKRVHSTPTKATCECSPRPVPGVSVANGTMSFAVGKAIENSAVSAALVADVLKLALGGAKVAQSHPNLARPKFNKMLFLFIY